MACFVRVRLRSAEQMAALEAKKVTGVSTANQTWFCWESPIYRWFLMKTSIFDVDFPLPCCITKDIWCLLQHAALWKWRSNMLWSLAFGSGRCIPPSTQMKTEWAWTDLGSWKKWFGRQSQRSYHNRTPLKERGPRTITSIIHEKYHSISSCVLISFSHKYSHFFKRFKKRENLKGLETATCFTQQQFDSSNAPLVLSTSLSAGCAAAKKRTVRDWTLDALDFMDSLYFDFSGMFNDSDFQSWFYVFQSYGWKMMEWNGMEFGDI